MKKKHDRWNSIALTTAVLTSRLGQTQLYLSTNYTVNRDLKIRIKYGRLPGTHAAAPQSFKGTISRDYRMGYNYAWFTTVEAPFNIYVAH